MKYKIKMPKTRPMPIFLKCGTADSTKEAMTMEVKTISTKSRKYHNKKKKSPIKIVLIIVPVDIEIFRLLFLSCIKT